MSPRKAHSISGSENDICQRFTIAMSWPLSRSSPDRTHAACTCTCSVFQFTLPVPRQCKTCQTMCQADHP